MTLLGEDGQVLAHVPVDADGRWTASADPGALAAAGQITAQLYDPAGIITTQLELRAGEGARLPLLPLTGAAAPGRGAQGPALALLLGMALLVGGVLFHQAGRVLRLLEAEADPRPQPRETRRKAAARRAAVRRVNQKGTPSRRP